MSSTMRAVMRALYVGRYKWQTTNEVAKRAGVSWTTARKKLRSLRRRGKVSRRRKGNRTYWRI